MDLGEDRTSLAISKKQVPYFTSSIPLGGRTFTDALQKGLGVSFEKAEELKVKYGLGKMKKDDMLYKIYNPLVENLITEMNKSIAFFEDTINQKEKVQKIILSGGGSLLRDLVGYLTERMKKEVFIGNAILDLDIPNDFSEGVQKGMAPFATAVGLAERACYPDD